MKYCKDYIGIHCVDGSCPNAIETEDGIRTYIKCKDCWLYKSCEDCGAPYYGCCPEGKEEA